MPIFLITLKIWNIACSRRDSVLRRGKTVLNILITVIYLFLPIIEGLQLIYYVLWAMMMNFSWFLNLTRSFNSLFSDSFALKGYTFCLDIQVQKMSVSNFEVLCHKKALHSCTEFIFPIKICKNTHFNQLTVVSI